MTSPQLSTWGQCYVFKNIFGENMEKKLSFLTKIITIYAKMVFYWFLRKTPSFWQENL
jgi:hypothetical protein